MVYFGDRSTGNCVDINQVQIYSQHFKIFQMACIHEPKCNFLHGFFQCQLPVETVDVEVRITSMQGAHMFRRDRTCQLIRCNPWSTRLCPPSLHHKEDENISGNGGKAGTQTPVTSQPVQSPLFPPPIPK